jgi:2-aminoadipate transaminase
MVAPEALIPKLTVIKEAADLETSAFMQRSISAYLDTGHLSGHLLELCEAYGARRDTMLRALETHFPAEARWTKPTSGMFIWVELPEAIDTRELLQRAVDEEHVAFIPGHAFCAGSHQAPHTMRLNFSNATPEQIEDGIERLGRVIQSYSLTGKKSNAGSRRT